MLTVTLWDVFVCHIQFLCNFRAVVFAKLTQKQTMPGSCAKCPMYCLAIWIPPCAVCAERGCGCDLLINILLCCLGWIPAIIHACYIVCTSPRYIV